MSILCGDPQAHYQAHQKEVNQAIQRVLEGGRYILDKEVGLFEQEFAQYSNVAHGIGVGSGTEALHIALRACSIGAGDEVITVSHTAVATISAIELAGATPVLVDIDPHFYTIDPLKIKEAISPKTKAIVPVHIYGQPADMELINAIAKQHNLKVIEDASQAHGAIDKNNRVGYSGDIGIFSCYPTKNLGAIGDAGIIVTNNAALAQKCRQLREYGWDANRQSQIPGLNSRLDEIQAAILRVYLKHLENDNDLRRRLAAIYTQELSETELILPQPRKGTEHVYHLYVIRSKQRERIKNLLLKHNVHAGIHYPVPVHQQPAYKGRIKTSGVLSNTEATAQEILSLPIFPELKESDVKMIASNIRSLFADSGTPA